MKDQQNRIGQTVEGQQAKEALRENETKYRVLYESSRDAIMTLAPPSWNFTSGNPSTIQMFITMDEADFVSRPPWEYSPALQPDGQPSADKAKEIIETAMREGSHFFEWMHKRLDGKSFPATVLLTRIELGGKSILQATVRDITERKRVAEALARSNALHRTTIDSLADAVHLVDRDLKIILFNKRFEQWCKDLGISAEVKDRQLEQAFPFLPSEVFAQYRQVLETGQPLTTEDEIELAGRRLVTETRKEPVLEENEVRGVLTIIRDITEQRKVQAQLHQAQKMEAIGRLAGGVAHDFNNVLCAISGHAELVLDDLASDAPFRESMDEIAKAANRAADLTHQLLAFSRKQIIDPKVIDLSHTIKNLHSMLTRLIGEDIILRTLPQKRLGRVLVDPGQIEQIVINLAVNARDAMPNGGELLIETADVKLDQDYGDEQAQAMPNAQVMLAVSDTGSGMSAEVREKIFEPFFTTKQLGQGTGLGLATVFGIVEQNDGRIEVHSEPGQGTSFKVYFPRVLDAAETLKQELAPEPVGGKETVLVVEDEEMVRNLAVRLLERRGYQVLATSSGGDAIVLAERHHGPIDLLLTDVVMPHMNGRELVERFAEIRPGIKVIYTSGYTQNVIAHHGVLDEGVQFIAKPYSLATLAARVREVLDKE